MLSPTTIDAIVQQISEIISRVIAAMKDGEAHDEDEITGELLGALREGLKDFRTQGVKWTTRAFRHYRNKGNEEGRIGADYLIVIDIDVAGTKVQKGFLVQAKRGELNERLPDVEWERLKKQRRLMRKASAEAYVALYTSEGIMFKRADKVKADKTYGSLVRHGMDSKEIFKGLFECHVGSRELTSITAAAIETRLAVALDGIVLSARPKTRAT